MSTVYYSLKIRDGRRLLNHLRDLGFAGLELEYRLCAETLVAMIPLIEKRDIRIYSVHNFLADPERDDPEKRGHYDLFLLSSLDPEERKKAIDRTKVTMDIAEKVGAKVVILHLGSVDFPNRSSLYRKLLTAGKKGWSEAEGLKEEYMSLRKRHRKRHLEAVLKSLDELNDEAGRRSLLLGVENRYHPHEIPDVEEMATILETFSGGALRYWHDVGHALNQQRHGIDNQDKWLRSFRDHLTGIHLHDIIGHKDHLAPGMGEVDFAGLLERLPPETLRIMEVKGTVSKEHFLAGRDLLLSLGY